MTPTPTAVPPGTVIGIVIADALNVRQGPSPDYPSLGQVKKGTRLDIVAKDPSGSWWLVCCVNQHEGWVSATYIQTEGPAASVPIAEPVPLPGVTVSPTIMSRNCDPSYPTVCIPPPPPDLSCDDIPYQNFKVIPPDPHGFDRDQDGVGCEQ